MQDAVLIFLLIALAALAGILFQRYRTQKTGITTVLHLISNLAQGSYSRRADPLLKGAVGELAHSSNKLADELDARSSRAQQDKDHLLSLLTVLDHSNEIAIATDNLDVIRLVNPAAARVLGQQVDAILGRKIDEAIQHPELLALYRGAFSASKPISAHVSLQAPDRSLHCHATAATIYTGPHYRGTLLLLRDITDAARTLQMKTDFVANASHELRTPLASIRAAVETIRECSGSGDAAVDTETTNRCIDIINSHALRLQLMVQDLLDLSRTEDPRAVVRSDRLDLQSVCEMITGMYTSIAGEKHVQLRIDLAPNAKTMSGDERLLTLTLKNLLDNAIKFTTQGHVTIRSYLQKHEGDDAPAANDFILEVKDTGCGIPPEDQERVFERFYTVNRSRGGSDRGTGLGLAIVKHAVAAMGGHVQLLSELNKGTTIRCIFPIATEVAA